MLWSDKNNPPYKFRHDHQEWKSIRSSSFSFSFLCLSNSTVFYNMENDSWDAKTNLFYYSTFQIYLNFVNYIVNFAFPILTLVVLNYQIYKELRKNLRHEVLLGRRHQNEQKKNALRKRDIRLTRISIIIVVIFMVCHIPRFIMNVIEMVYGDLSKVRSEIYI